MLYEKRYQFKTLPNYFCIQFQRLRDESMHLVYPIEASNIQHIFRLKQATHFKLFAVISHVGQQCGDQYETVVLHGDSMVSFRDQTVRRVDLKYLLQVEPYMLFYEAVPD